MDPNCPDIGHQAPSASFRRGVNKLLNDPVAGVIEGAGAAVRATIRVGLKHPLTLLPAYVAGKALQTLATALIMSVDDPSITSPEQQKHG